MDYTSMTLLQIKNLPGVNDLPSKAGSYLAMALKAEANGEYKKADIRLNQAVDADHAQLTSTRGKAGSYLLCWYAKIQEGTSNEFKTS